MFKKFNIILFLFYFSCATHEVQIDNSIKQNISLKDKISQMIMIRMDGNFHNNESWKKKDIEYFIKKYKIGGLITFTGNIHGTFENIKYFQSISETPLFIASDYERGLGVFINGTLFPSNMAIAATGDTTYSYLQGKITAIEAKSIGVNFILAPVLDINNNKNNPIINFRSYGDNPELVSKYGISFIEGVQDQGLIACAKHYPGHGNTNTDSHTRLPIIDISKKELYDNELYPFKKAVLSGVKSIMTGHIVIPSIDQDNIPATFSKKIVNDVLIEDWNYNGLIITDALEMGALTSNVWHGESAIKAIEAGADILLLPLNATSAIESIYKAVQNGRISLDRINYSYNKIIKQKKEMGLFTPPYNDWSDVEDKVASLENRKIANKIAEKSITLVKNNKNIIPFKPSNYKKVTHLLLSTDNDLRQRLKPFARDIRYIHGNVNEVYVNDKLTSLGKQDILNKIKGSELIIVSMLIRISMDKGLSTIDNSHNELLSDLKSLNIPVVGISFGSPYLPDYNYLDAYLCSYGYGSVSLNASTDALFGRKDISGELPINLNDIYKVGHGLKVKKNYKIFDSQLNIDLDESFDIIYAAISDTIFPGAQLFVSKGNKILINKSFGKYTYEEDSKIITNKSIYDVASLTKVLSTTPVAMKLIQKKLLSLDFYLSDFYPEFNIGNKKKITVRHLLTHSSGLPPYVEYYKIDSVETKSDIINNIVNLDLEYEPDEKMIYSDLGMILLYDIIEKVSNSSLDKLSDKYFYKPFNMSNTYFNPINKDIVVPTEYDNHYRMKLIKGEVHDENAYILNGVSGHAGLFSNATDIGIFSKFFLNEGVLFGRRYLKKDLIRIFTSKKKNPVHSDRALGWDTPSKKGSSSGDYFSTGSYGHLGFTGTSLWIDPNEEIIIVFLTNRVYPTRNNKGIYNIRRELHNSIMTNIKEY
jgi:beta-glucosidase-like glycosyl hydrolase/CubicO group peptidase (beta-lactamase class C family)